MSKQGTIQAALWLLFGGSFLAVYLPTIINLVRAWSSSDDHSHGFAIIPLSLYLLWRTREALQPGGRAAWAGIVIAAAALLASLVAARAGMLTLAPVAMVLFIWGTVIFLCGAAAFRACLFPLGLLFLMIPVPSQLMAALTIPLQLMVSRCSVWLGAAAGIDVYREGNVIHLAGRTMEVVQACSGLRSIMALVTVCAVIGYFMLRTNLFRTALVAVALLCAVAVNILRVFALIASSHYSGLDLTQGSGHTALGIAMFVVASALLFLAAKGFRACEC